jgi:stage III sporulation protein AA
MPDAWEEEILPLLAPRLAAAVRSALNVLPLPPEEIRVREGRPLELVCSGGSWFVTAAGSLAEDPLTALLPDREELFRTFQLMAQGSVYAWEEELRAGFLTVGGGHRVGICGRAVVEAGRLRTVRPVASLNIRIARAVPGAASPLLPRLVRRGSLLSTLLIAPPQAGKTTVLRDLVRQVSEGVPPLGLPGAKVAVVDERSEIGGCIGGVPSMRLGPRTDVLDGCPKADGIMLLLRAMSPQVIAVDEVGRPEDAHALVDALHAGVTVVATAHGTSPGDVMQRPGLRPLFEAGAFARAAVLSRRKGPGTLEQVVDLEGGLAAHAR